MADRDRHGRAGALLRVAGLLVPPAQRAAWTREWRAELAEARRLGRSPLAMAWGVFADAWTVRRCARMGRGGGDEAWEEDRAMADAAMDSRKGWGATLREMAHESKRALRSLLRAPGFTVASVLTLAVGLGATATIVTLVDGILLRPLPYPSAERVMRVGHTFKGSDGPNPVARFTLPYFREQNHSFEAMGGYWSPTAVTLSGDEAAERVSGVRATAGLLGVIGAHPAVGRLFTADDAALENGSGVVLSHRLWVRRYGADPSVVGTSVTLDGMARPVLGVMAAGVQLPEAKVDVWVPYAVPAGTRPDDAFRINILARLRAGVDPAAGQADVENLTRRLPEYAPFYRTLLDDFNLSTRVRPVLDEVVGGVERPLWIVLGAVFIVLLIAAANVSTLFLVRAEGRRQEVGIRAALGAGRAGLVGHFLAETLWISLAAGVSALALAWGAVRLFIALAPPAVPRLDEIGLGWPTVAVVVALCVTIALALGLYPFVRFGRGGAGFLRGRTTGEARGQSAVGSGMVVVQVALALVLLSGSGLLIMSFQRLRSVDPGFSPDGILMSEFSLPEPAYPSPGDVHVFEARLLEGVRALPGVEQAALGPSPLDQGGCNGLYVEGMVLQEGQFPPCVPVVFVTPAYMDVLGIRQSAGRTFGPGDLDPSAEPVAIVSDNVARRLWPDGDPLQGGVHPSPRHGPPWFRIVGVVDAIRGQGPDQPTTEAVYLPVGEMDGEGWLTRTQTLLVRTAPGRETEIAPALRGIVSGLDASVPLTVNGSLADAQARTMARSTFTLFLLGTAAATALVLGLVGLYGVVAYRVGRRNSEIGLRMAMGARASQVRMLVLGHSLRMVLAGTVIGVLASLLLTRTLASLLFGVEPGDPLTLGAAAGALMVTALAATWVPAQRATRVDPATALRNE